MWALGKRRIIRIADWRRVSLVSVLALCELSLTSRVLGEVSPTDAMNEATS